MPPQGADRPATFNKPIAPRMSGGPVGAVSPLLEAKLSVSERVDVDTTRRRSGTCYVTRYGNVRDVVHAQADRHIEQVHSIHAYSVMDGCGIQCIDR